MVKCRLRHPIEAIWKDYNKLNRIGNHCPMLFYFLWAYQLVSRYTYQQPITPHYSPEMAPHHHLSCPFRNIHGISKLHETSR